MGYSFFHVYHLAFRGIYTGNIHQILFLYLGVPKSKLKGLQLVFVPADSLGEKSLAGYESGIEHIHDLQ
jgi:hypothetical protein